MRLKLPTCVLSHVLVTLSSTPSLDIHSSTQLSTSGDTRLLIRQASVFLKGAHILDNSQTAKKSKSIHFKGVIGTLRFDKTKGGVPKLTMNIAEHPNAKDPSETVWHKKCVATRELAETLNSLSPPLSVGEEIEVKVGYPYSWQYTDKQGRNRVNEGVNLWIVSLRGQTYAAKRSTKK